VTDRTVNVKLRMDVAQYMAGARGATNANKDLDKSARDVRAALDEEEDAAGRVRVAEAKLTEVREKGTAKASELAAAQENLAKAARSHELALDKSAAATDRWTKLQAAAGEESGKSLANGIADGVDKNSGQVDSAVEKIARRTEAKFSALKFVGLSAGLPAAGLVGAVGVGAALAGVPALFAVMGVAALANSEAVAGSFEKMSTRVRDDAEKMAQPLEGTVVRAADKLTASFVRMEPQIGAAMRMSANGVDELVTGVTELAENAMPGMLNMVRESGPALAGMESMLSDVGAGAGDMFTAMSTGSEGAGQGLKVTGGLLRDLEGFAGNLFANLANGSSGPLTHFRGTLSAVEDTALSLTSNGMPALQSTTSGFLNVVSGGVGVLKAGADALGSWAQPLGSMAGGMLATNSIAKLFGTSLGETGFGLRAFATSVDAAGNKTSPFKQALADTEAGGSKLNRGLGAIVDGGFNPLGIALLAGGVLLDKFGEAQQKASEAAAAHRENVRSLTDAIRQDGGAIGARTSAANVDSLTTKNAAANLAVYGGTMASAKLAIEGNAGATATLTNKSDDMIASFVRQSGLSVNATKGLQDLNHQLLQSGGSYETVKDKVNELVIEQTKLPGAIGPGTVALTESTTKMSASQSQALVAIFNANGAIGEQVKAQREAYDAYLAAESALSGLTTQQVANRDATNAATQATYAQQNASLGYRGAVLSTQDALLALKTVNEDSKATELDKQKALLGVERAYAAQEQAAYNAAYANSTASTDAQKVTEANAAMNAETVKLASTLGNNLPASMQATIAKMNASDAVAAGLTVSINGTGQAVYRLPNGKEIVLTANTAAANSALQYFQNKIDAIHGKTVTVTTSFVDVYSSNTRSQTGPSRMFAKGGLVGYASGGEIQSIPKLAAGRRALDVRGGAHLRGPGTGTSDDMLLWGSNGEYMVKEKQTKKYLPILQAINNDTLGFADGGLVGAAKEMLAQVSSGGQFFEDFSFRGSSSTVNAYNDEIQDMFRLARGPGWAFDGTERTRSDITGWLQHFINTSSQAPINAVQQAITSGSAVNQTARAGGGGYSTAGQQGGGTEVHVYLGDREITDIVRTEIKYTNRQTKRSVTAGSGGAR
jgi:hypothetical protein